MTAATTFAALILWVVAGRRWFTMRNTPGQRALTHSICALAVSATLFIPAVDGWLGASFGLPHLGSLLMFASGAFAALAVTGALRFMEYSDDQARDGALLRRTLIVLVVIGVGIALFVGQPQSTVSGPWTDQLAMYAFWILWLGFVASICAWIAVRVASRWGRMTRSRVRMSLGLIGLAAVSGLIYSLAKSIIVAASLHGVTLGAVAVVSQVAAVGMLVLVAVGSIYVSMPGSRRWQRARDARLAAELAPLWEELRVVDPAVELAGRSPDVELYRMVIECRDWIRQLRFSMPDSAWDEAVIAARSFAPSGRNAECIATAGWISAGLESFDRSERPVPPSPAPPTGRDLDDEIEFLVRVSQVPDLDVERVRAKIPSAVPAIDEQHDSVR